MNQNLQIWTFGYKKNPQPATTACVAGENEAEAVRVAQRWCEINNARFFGSVRPFVVAGPEILLHAAVAPVPESAEPVPATNATLMDKARALVGR